MVEMLLQMLQTKARLQLFPDVLPGTTRRVMSRFAIKSPPVPFILSHTQQSILYMGIPSGREIVKHRQLMANLDMSIIIIHVHVVMYIPPQSDMEKLSDILTILQLPYTYMYFVFNLPDIHQMYWTMSCMTGCFNTTVMQI